MPPPGRGRGGGAALLPGAGVPGPGSAWEAHKLLSPFPRPTPPPLCRSHSSGEGLALIYPCVPPRVSFLFSAPIVAPSSPPLSLTHIPPPRRARIRMRARTHTHLGVNDPMGSSFTTAGTHAGCALGLALSLQREQKPGKDPVRHHTDCRATPLRSCYRPPAAAGCGQGREQLSEDGDQCPGCPPLGARAGVWAPCSPGHPPLLLQLPWGPCFPSSSLLHPKSPADLSVL